MPFKNPHPLYTVWQSMKARCRNPKSRAWNDYGGRGIAVCTQWENDFHAFVRDMGPRPKGYSLDRIDNDGDYTPENCRWTDRKTQQRNQRRAAYVEIEGRRYRLIELAEKSGHKPDTIKARAALGLSFDQVMCSEIRIGWSGLALGPAAKSRLARERTHCRNGHEFTEANTLYTKEGWKRCRACHNAKMRRLNAAKRG
jgi:hypothetical protein